MLPKYLRSADVDRQYYVCQGQLLRPLENVANVSPSLSPSILLTIFPLILSSIFI